MSPCSVLDSPVTVAGIDIGGARKGCRLVVLRSNDILCNISSCDPELLARERNAHGAMAIGIDSPCRWAQA